MFSNTLNWYFSCETSCTQSCFYHVLVSSALPLSDHAKKRSDGHRLTTVLVRDDHVRDYSPRVVFGLLFALSNALGDQHWAPKGNLETLS